MCLNIHVTVYLRKYIKRVRIIAIVTYNGTSKKNGKMIRNGTSANNHIANADNRPNRAESNQTLKNVYV